MPRPAKLTPVKQCEICGTTLQRKRFNGRLEDYSAFSRRQFCSLSCANSRSKGGDSSTKWHVLSRIFAESSCEACGSQMNLQVHHVDGDYRNNAMENLQTLCESCHHSWHARHQVRGLKPMTRMPKEPVRLRTLCPEAVPILSSDSLAEIVRAG